MLQQAANFNCLREDDIFSSRYGGVNARRSNRFAAGLAVAVNRRITGSGRPYRSTNGLSCQNQE